LRQERVPRPRQGGKPAGGPGGGQHRLAPLFPGSAPTIYISTLVDKAGEAFVGDRTYRLRVPANVPAKQYWSISIYDWDTAGFIREAAVVSLDSYNEKMKRNPDGSVDLVFASGPPAGQENNWISTKKGGLWFATFRLYGPDKPFFDKSWRLPDIERAK
jgi:hypothetical protein